MSKCKHGVEWKSIGESKSAFVLDCDRCASDQHHHRVKAALNKRIKKLKTFVKIVANLQDWCYDFPEDWLKEFKTRANKVLGEHE